MTEKPDENRSPSPKGILKTPKQSKKQKSFKWDEMNILATYHPADKTYGHMKVDEPKTPFVFESDDASGSTYGASFSAEDLAARLTAAKEGSDELLPRAAREPDIDPVEAEHQKQFREKRRLHYNEFLAAKMAKGQLEDVSDEDEELRRATEEAARNARLNAKMFRSPLSTSIATASARRNRSRSPVRDSTPNKDVQKSK